MGNKMPNCVIPYPSRDKHLHMVLSTEQVKLVQGSWELLKDDLGRLGLIVFLRAPFQNDLLQKRPNLLTYSKLWPSLNYGLQKVLEEYYTKSVAEAWKTVYAYICVYMKMGMENSDIDPDITSEIGR
ncbi:hypothetical protein MAR_001573 [Mya arenaria]|uniref:Uncharacterized protein n=1 Tax=Mya arenaria TaxID=6604 RepID=A0ABY7FC75_MYAAR|nr:hypothetical protein MAR_001573 [Mya arenaria]